MRFQWSKLLALALLNLGGANSFSAWPKVSHAPEQPRSGEAVIITARFKAPYPRDVVVQYQVVEPGRYVALDDPAFQMNWASIPMQSAQGNGDAETAKNALVATLPGALQANRRLVRYRIAVKDGVIAPSPDDSVPNFAYFVYDVVPPWRGAINPNAGSAKLRNPVTFGTNVMRSLPVYQLISKKSSIENATWYEQAPFRDDAARKKYNYTGTFVADDGKVYDHIRFRARGGQWRYGMGKNMWKLDFNRGEHLQARDNFGRKYKARWEKLDLGACIQQGSYGMRGEHGMFEAVAFKLFNLAGVEAPLTHWVHFRIVDEVEENPANQYEGDFWGLYLATENVDDAFLKEHELPSGNLYKMEFGQPDLHSKSQFAQPNNDDARRFMAAYRAPQEESWWRTNVDLPRYFSYRSIVECIHHYDIYNGKNYFYYHNPADGRWSMLPWDVDLTWADHMHGTGMEPFYRAGIPLRPPFKTEYQNRLREIRDLLYNPEQMDALIEEYAAIISNPGGGMSFVDADRARWDFHPILASQFVLPNKTRQGQFYVSSATHDFRGMLQVMRNYLRRRSAWVDATLLSDAPIPPTPSITAGGLLEGPVKQLSFRASFANRRTTAPVIQWRVAEVTPDSSDPLPNRKYEIIPLWQTNGTPAAQVPANLLEAGHTYRVRARAQDASGRCGHWSAPVELVGR